MTETPAEMLARQEGFEGKPYKCTSGKLTIGYGFNLDDWPLTEAECLPILESRMRQVRVSLCFRANGGGRRPVGLRNWPASSGACRNAA